MKGRRRPFGPIAQRRIAAALLIAAASAGGVGAWLRARDNGAPNATYLLNAAAFLNAALGAIVEAKTAELFLAVSPAQVKRRAVALTGAGLPAALGGCVLASTVAGSDDAPLAAAGALALLTLGVGLLLAGLFSLAWCFGTDYAARRIQKLSDEDW